MQSIKIQLALFILAVLFFTTTGNAAIKASPTVSLTGEKITVTMTGIVPAPIMSLVFSVKWGDGTAVSSPTHTGVGSYSFITTHKYSQAGSFTITGTTTFSTAGVPPPPVVETRRITIMDAIDTVPRGTVGERYKHNLASTPSLKTSSFRITKGRLPPGLKMERTGLITGTPTEKGKFEATLSITNQSGVQLGQSLIIFIDPGKLILQVTPDEIEISRSGRTQKRVTFSVISPTIKIKETIRSTRGEFLAGGKVIGYNYSPMNINLNTDKPSGTETIRITDSILRSAQKNGTSKITYRRFFRTLNLQPGGGDTRINLRTSAGGQLRFTKLRIFFEQNNRPLIVVTRNSRNLVGGIEIHYNGSGTLKGYWKVDGRIIQRVQKNVFYGKVMTLKTPTAPRLPTYSEGAHRLQFIITEPKSAQQTVAFPEAIYHVEAKKAVVVVPLSLNSPDNNATLTPDGKTFIWSEAPVVSTYLVEFFEESAEKPFFTAYTKKGTYTLPPLILNLKFIQGNSYSWRIRGYNKASVLTAESSDRFFTLSP